MFDRKKLVNRRYDQATKQILSFDYYSEPADDDEFYRVSFYRINDRSWQFICSNFVTYEDDGISLTNAQNYTGMFTLPRSEMPLEFIATVGLQAMYQVFVKDYGIKSAWAADLFQELNR